MAGRAYAHHLRAPSARRAMEWNLHYAMNFGVGTTYEGPVLIFNARHKAQLCEAHYWYSHCSTYTSTKYVDDTYVLWRQRLSQMDEILHRGRGRWDKLCHNRFSINSWGFEERNASKWDICVCWCWLLYLSQIDQKFTQIWRSTWENSSAQRSPKGDRVLQREAKTSPKGEILRHGHRIYRAVTEIYPNMSVHSTTDPHNISSNVRRFPFLGLKPPEMGKLVFHGHRIYRRATRI